MLPPAGEIATATLEVGLGESRGHYIQSSGSPTSRWGYE
jgi:hypothetical protein